MEHATAVAHRKPAVSGREPTLARKPGDRFEQEADRTAKRVMRADASAPPAISRMAHDPQRMEAPVQRSSRSPLREHPQPSVRNEPSRSSLRESPEPSRYFEPSRSPLRDHPECCATVQRVESESHAAPHAPEGFSDRLGASKGGGQPVAPE